MSFPSASPSPPEPEPKHVRALSAHMDAGTITVSLIGAMLSFMVYQGVSKLDKMTDQIALLNEKVAIVLTRHEAQAKKDDEQDRRIELHKEQIRELEKLVLSLRASAK